MKMPPVARKAYLTIVLVAVTAYLVAMGTRGVRWIQHKQEHAALAVGPALRFMTDLAPAIDRYTVAHQGDLPLDIPLSELLPRVNGADTASFIETEKNSALRIQWNASVQNLRQCENARFTILWIDDPRYPAYIVALTTTGRPPLIAEILPRALQPDTARPALLRP